MGGVRLVMRVFEPTLLIWFLMYAAYCYYKLNGLLGYMKSFYERGMLSRHNYDVLSSKYTGVGVFRYYAMLPDKKQYSKLYEDAAFSRFSLRIRYMTIFFGVTGIVIFVLALHS